MRAKKLCKLIILIMIFECIGVFLGFLTKAEITNWYTNLHKSAWTPPGYVFSIAWTILYAMLGFVAWELSINKIPQDKHICLFFYLQMLMNWLWTPLFFSMHLIVLSSAWLIILTLINVFLILKTINTHRTMAITIAPYVIWLGFASYLNLIIALLN